MGGKVFADGLMLQKWSSQRRRRGHLSAVDMAIPQTEKVGHGV